MKKMLLCALIAMGVMNVNNVLQSMASATEQADTETVVLQSMASATEQASVASIATNVTNNTNKTIVLRFGMKSTPGLARILKPGEVKTFYNSCSFIIAIADIDLNNIPDGISNIESLLSAASNEDEAVKIINKYRNNADYINAIDKLTFKFVTVDNQPNICQYRVDRFNFTVSEDANGQYKVNTENANLQNLSTPAVPTVTAN